MTGVQTCALPISLVDPIEKQKLQKLIADTRISEAKATVAERLGNESDDKLDELMDKLISESDKPKDQT